MEQKEPITYTAQGTLFFILIDNRLGLSGMANPAIYFSCRFSLLYITIKRRLEEVSVNWFTTKTTTL